MSCFPISFCKLCINENNEKYTYIKETLSENVLIFLYLFNIDILWRDALQIHLSCKVFVLLDIATWQQVKKLRSKIKIHKNLIKHVLLCHQVELLK